MSDPVGSIPSLTLNFLPTPSYLSNFLNKLSSEFCKGNNSDTPLNNQEGRF